MVGTGAKSEENRAGSVSGAGAGGAAAASGLAVVLAGAWGELPPHPGRSASDAKTRQQTAENRTFFMDVSSQVFGRFPGKVLTTG